MTAKVRDRPEARTAYEADFAAWLLEQAKLIRAGRSGDIDADNIAEELEGMARSEFRALVSALKIILLHMLKWDHQPERRSASWMSSINEQRDQYELILEDNPSFRRRLPEALERAYRQARRGAAHETGLSLQTFPTACPYDLDSVLERPHATPDAAPR